MVHWDGYMAEVVWIDGLHLTPTSFGEFDEDSPTIWKPIDVSDLTFGNNGFYLDFKDSANLGAMTSANGGTDFAENNIVAIINLRIPAQIIFARLIHYIMLMDLIHYH